LLKRIQANILSSCHYCHGWKELEYHPIVYKTRKCKDFEGHCNKQLFCPFYHREEEKRYIDEEEKYRQAREINIKRRTYHLQTEA
jgi:hypothetical protein